MVQKGPFSNILVSPPRFPKDTATSARALIYLSSGAVFSPRLRSKWRSTSEKLEWSDGSQPANPTTAECYTETNQNDCG